MHAGIGALLFKSPKETPQACFCFRKFPKTCFSLLRRTFFFRTRKNSGRHYVAQYRGVQDSVGIRHKLVRGHFTSGCAAGAERDIPLFLQADVSLVSCAHARLTAAGPPPVPQSAAQGAR